MGIIVPKTVVFDHVPDFCDTPRVWDRPANFVLALTFGALWDVLKLVCVVEYDFVV